MIKISASLPFTTAAVLAILIAGPWSAQAAILPCNLAVPAAELVSIQENTSLGEDEQLAAEIGARRKLLDAAIACDQEEIAVRQEALSRLPDKIKALPAYNEIAKGLGDANHYYEEQKKEIPVLGLSGLRGFSRFLAKWRPTGYLPIITWADNFLLWADNQQFLDKASGRLEQIGGVAFSLKLVNQDEVNNLFNAAKEKFGEAIKENDEARDALNQKRPTIALGHTTASLQALSDTYQLFFNLQEALKKLVK